MLDIDPSLDATIIIPTYNRAPMLEATLASIERQSVDLKSFEVIVADDGSSDTTVEVIRKYDKVLRLKYVYHGDHGYMPARVRNFGIRLAEGRICIFLDCGNLVSRSFVRGHIEAHQTGNREAVIGYIFGFNHTDDNTERVLSVLDMADVDASINLMAADGLLDVRESFYRPSNDQIDRFSAAWGLFWGGNISLRTDLVRQVGGFDEWYQSWGVDDIDLGLAAKLAGAHFVLSREGAAIQFPHHKDLTERLVSHRRNIAYLHSKVNLPVTEALVASGGSLKKMVLESLDK